MIHTSRLRNTFCNDSKSVSESVNSSFGGFRDTLNTFAHSSMHVSDLDNSQQGGTGSSTIVVSSHDFLSSTDAIVTQAIQQKKSTMKKASKKQEAPTTVSVHRDVGRNIKLQMETNSMLALVVKQHSDI